MDSILEALLESRLNAFDAQFMETEEYQTLKAQMDSCVERYADIIGEENRPFLDQFLALLFERNRLVGRTASLHGFRLGALGTIEVYINRDNLIASTGKQPGDSAKRSPAEQGYQDLILRSLSEGSVITYGQERSIDERTPQLEETYGTYHKIISLQLERNGQDFSQIDEELHAINLEMLELQCNRRYAYGYSLGVLMITEIFQGREKLVVN